MSAELAKIPNDLSVAKLGTIFVQSGFFRDTKDQAQAVVKILYGRELGFTPVVSMMGIHIIEGKPSLSSNLMGTLVKRSGRYDYRVRENTEKVCRIEFLQRNGAQWDSLGESVFTIDDAKTAGVVRAGGGWTKYPKAMLFARALSAGVKLHCPDVSACPLYVPEEMGAVVNEDGDVEELPKSARAVAVTEEDIVIGGGAAEPLVRGEAAPQATDTGYIDQGQAVNFARTFKDALKPTYRKDATTIEHAWLRKQGIVDEDGTPTAKVIRKDSFFEVRESAVQFAAEYKGEV